MNLVCCKRLLILSLSLALCSCVTSPSGQTDAQFVSERKIYAQQLEQKKDLSGALNQWQIASILKPSDPEIKSAIARLEQQLHARAETYFSKGRAAYKRGNIRLAETYFLKTLAADPYHQAFNYLEKITTKRMQAAQNNKNQTTQNTEQYQPSPSDSSVSFTQLQDLFKQKKYLAISKLTREGKLPKTDSRVLSLLYETDFQLTQHYIQNRDMTRATFHFKQMQTRAPKTTAHSARANTLKKQLAEGYYAQAKTHINNNLTQTVQELEKALDYNPQHAGARILLNQTQRMQKNLLKIKQSN